MSNRCNHDKTAPAHFRAKRNQDLHTLQKRIRRFYDRPVNLFKNLRNLNNRRRQVRTERREAVCAVLSCLVAFYDYGQDCFGVLDRDTGKFRRFGCEFIQRQTGLSMPRIWRALSDLQKAGYLHTVHKPVVVDGELVHQVAVRKLTGHLWGALNAWNAIERLAKRAKARNRKLINRLKGALTRRHTAALERDVEARTGRQMPRGPKALGAILSTLRTS